LEKFLAKRRSESPEQREKRLEKQKKEREEGRAFVHDVVNAYDFRLVGNDSDFWGRPWVIEAMPRKDFQPTQTARRHAEEDQGPHMDRKEGL